MKAIIEAGIVDNVYKAESGKTYVTLLEPTGEGRKYIYKLVVEEGAQIPPLTTLVQVYRFQLEIGGMVWGMGKDSNQSLLCADFKASPAQFNASKS